MKISEQIRRIYEERPYPSGDERALRDLKWRLPPVEWMQALGCPESAAFVPQRILVAGCGTGTEAFNLSRTFPGSQITAADFSARSIAVAKGLQEQAPQLGNIQFLVADLASPRLHRIVGGDYDFISCHGVLSYIPAPTQALGNFQRCLKPDGLLYVGVNGVSHISEKLRQALPLFGYKMARFREEPSLRKILKLCDTVLGLPRPVRMSRQKPEYLGGDLFGALILNQPLARWTDWGRQSGLHFLGNFSSARAFRPVADSGVHSLLMPRSRAEVSEFLELLVPSSFHRLLFSRCPEVNPPWNQLEELLPWRPLLTKLYQSRLPPAGPRKTGLSPVRIISQPMDARLEWQMPGWEIDLLRSSDGQRSLGAILNEIQARPGNKILRQQLYLLYQLAVLNLLPPSPLDLERDKRPE